MTTYTISHCTVADAAALSTNNIPAFWQDPHWVLTWRHVSLEHQIAQVTRRFPRNLLNDPEIKRHQKAVDPETGRIVGYARWFLPTTHTTNADGTPAWPEAVVPAVSPEEEVEFRRIAATAIWNPSSDDDADEELLSVTKKEILARKPYMRLDYLAVHPENQRRGIATALVKSGMIQAEKMGLDIFVLAFQAGLEVYKRLGFCIEKELVQDDSAYGGKGEYHTYFMIYEQKPGE